ncbi:MAG: hemolysin family protein [Bacillus sp. (in: firmicutes)]
MDGLIALNLFLVVVFIALTAFFVGAEFAILKVRMSRLDQLIAEGNKKAVMAKKVAQGLDYYLSACQLGITITALVLGALGEPTVEKMLHPLFERFDVPDAASTVLSYGIALALVTFLHVVFGELAPKTLAIQYSERVTLLLASPLYWFGKIMYPFITFLNGSSRVFLGWFGVKPAGHETVYSEEELKLIVTQSYRSGEINHTELSYLQNIFSFDERQLKEIMIPEAKMAMLEKEMNIDDIINVLDSYNYTRYPVVERGRKDRVLGFINTKEMLTSIAAGKEASIEKFIHEMPRFPETALIKDVLLAMQKNRIHMTVVMNEQEKVVGLVTMEDILEKIVGEIREELPAT